MNRPPHTIQHRTESEQHGDCFCVSDEVIGVMIIVCGRTWTSASLCLKN